MPSRSKSKTTKSKTKSMRKTHRGGVRMPSEYFGVESGHYYPEGSSALNSGSSAYGQQVAVSHGTILNDQLAGPNLGPSQNGTSTTTQTGGKGRKTRKTKMKSKSKWGGGKKSRKTKRQTSRK
jgi:hypothetical protein